MVLVATIVAVLALRQPLHKWPVAFYALAVVADVAYIAGIEGLLPRAVMSPLTLLMGKCMLSLALFVVVMYIGVFAKGSRVHQWLKPVRAELSILACILACGHMAVYLASYAPRLGGAMGANVLSALVVALALLVLLLVLGVTSFGFVKKHMRTESRGGEAALITVAVYTVVFGAYAVLRVRRALIDRRVVAAVGVSATAPVDDLEAGDCAA